MFHNDQSGILPVLPASQRNGAEKSSCHRVLARERTHGIDGTNDRSENKFAIADYVMRTYRGISVFNASGIVQQRSAHDFDRPSRVVSDRRKRKQTAEPPPEFTGGFFWTLSRALRHSLLTMARHELEAAGCRCCPLGMGGGP
jgi:hypothetical protein